MLGNSLFEAVKLNKDLVPDEYQYSGYGIKFDARKSVPLSDGGRFGKNVTLFRAERSSSVSVDNKKKYLNSS